MREIRISCEAPLVPLSELKVIQGDLKTLTKERFEDLSKAIEKDGFAFAIHYWVNEEGQKCILDGTQRYRVASKQAGDGIWKLDAVPAVQVHAASFKDAVLTLLHGASSYGEADSQGLYELTQAAGLDVSELEEVALSGVDIDKHKAEYYESAEVEGQDEVPEPPKEAKTKLGELWLLGEHRLLIGDCTVKENVDRLMAGERAILCFTNPPYSDQRDYLGSIDLSTKKLSEFLCSNCSLFAVNLGIKRADGEYEPYWDDYIKKAHEKGLKLLSWNVWDKMQAGSVGNQTAMFPIEHEWIFVFGKERVQLNKTEDCKWANLPKTTATRNKDGSLTPTENRIVGTHKPLGTVLRHYPEKARNHGCDHPAMFPVGFAEKYIEACTQKNDWVFEPFCGSGSTLIACEKTNRKCFGMEIEPLYGDVILSRWAKFTGKDPVREDGVRWSEINAQT